MNFNEGLNLESFRERNIRTINNLVKEFESYKKDMSSTKSRILVNIYNNKDYKTNEEKENAWDVACDAIEDEIIEQNKDFKNNLRRTIRIQAKELLRLKTDEEIYKYYKLITEKELSDEYNPMINTSLKEFESDIYRQFLMANPRIENIIISYSILEDEKNNNLPPKENIEEILHYIEIAKNRDLTESERKDALGIAFDLTNKLEDGEQKEGLLAELEEIRKEIELLADPNYDTAKELVEKAEETEKSEDFTKALKFLEKLQVPNRGEFAARLDVLRKKAEERFVKLLEEIKYDINTNGILVNEKFLELEDKYKYVSKEITANYAQDFSDIIIFNNNLKQEEVKENYQPKKAGLLASIGQAATFVKGSKIATKVSVKLLNKVREKVNSTENSALKEKFEKLASKVESNLVKNTIVGGLKLFVSEKKLEKLKTKLYDYAEYSKLSDRKQKRLLKKQEKACRNIEKQLVKGLNSKTKIQPVTKEIATSMIDQYLYLIATSPSTDDEGNFDLSKHIEALYQYLEENKELFTENEYKAIVSQTELINDYRVSTNGEIYQITSGYDEQGEVTTELDDVVKYYDSDECKLSFREAPVYIKR